MVTLESKIFGQLDQTFTMFIEGQSSRINIPSDISAMLNNTKNIMSEITAPNVKLDGLPKVITRKAILRVSITGISSSAQHILTIKAVGAQAGLDVEQVKKLQWTINVTKKVKEDPNLTFHASLIKAGGNATNIAKILAEYKIPPNELLIMYMKGHNTMSTEESVVSIGEKI